MNSLLHTTHDEARRAGKATALLSQSQNLLEQENARLRIALREARHRSYNQWQLLIGLADLEQMRSHESASRDFSVRLSTMASAFMNLNRTLDTDGDALISDRQVDVRDALAVVLTQFQAILEKDALQFTVQPARLPEKGCTALMLIATELIMNAGKYGRKRTQVTFCVEGNEGILEVQDDGPGFPTGFRVQEQARHGLQLVEALCRFDLRGEMYCYNSVRGGVVKVTFPLSPEPKTAPILEANRTFAAMEGVVWFG